MTHLWQESKGKTKIVGMSQSTCTGAMTCGSHVGVQKVMTCLWVIVHQHSGGDCRCLKRSIPEACTIVSLHTMYLLTEWEGRTGKYLAGGHATRPDLTQSISILSYDPTFIVKRLRDPTKLDQNSARNREGRTAFEQGRSTCPALVTAFPNGFIRACAEPYRSYDKTSYNVPWWKSGAGTCLGSLLS